MAQYFEPEPTVPSDTTTFEVVLPDLAFSLTTDRGVFSHGRLDTGTGLLLREAPAPPSRGNLLDLGAGAGAIALTLALRAPAATVWAVDVNARARELVALNAARAGIDNVVVADPDDVPADVTFDAVWSNPPIRIGKAALHALLTRWLSRLTPRGEAVLVVQKHLGADSLHAWLRTEGYAVERLVSRQAFRLLRVARR